MGERAKSAALPIEYQELLRYCPVLATDPESVRKMDIDTLQMLSCTARNNAAERQELQRQGIARAQAQGVRFGRPAVKLPKNFHRIVAALEAGEITGAEAIRQSGVSSATFYRYLRKFREQN